MESEIASLMFSACSEYCNVQGSFTTVTKFSLKCISVACKDYETFVERFEFPELSWEAADDGFSTYVTSTQVTDLDGVDYRHLAMAWPNHGCYRHLGNEA